MKTILLLTALALFGCAAPNIIDRQSPAQKAKNAIAIKVALIQARAAIAAQNAKAGQVAP